MLPRFLLLAALTCAATASAQAPPAVAELYKARIDPAAIDTRTDWYGIYLKDKKIGYARVGRSREKDGTIRESETVNLKLVTLAAKVEMQIDEDTFFDAEPPYALRRAQHVSRDGQVEQKTTLERKGDGYELVHTASGVPHKRQIEDLDYSLRDAMADEMWVRSNPRVGDKISVLHYDLQEQKIDIIDNRLAAKKTSLAGGVEVRVFEIEGVTRDKNIRALNRLDGKGRILSAQIATIFELRLEPEAKAKDTQFSTDLFVMGMAKIDRKLGHPRKVAELVVAVNGKDNAPLPDGPRQSMAADDDGQRLLKLGAAHGKRVEATPADIKTNLAESPSCPIKDEAVQALAKKAVGDATEPREKVKRLVSFVHDYVKPQMNGSLPEVHDLIKRKQGDCKSYALLLTNLARASGIPAREVSGLLYVGDDYKAFGGHAWNEVVLDGAWVPVDASLDETELDAAHISFGDEGRAISRMLETLGKLSFRVVNVKFSR